jgi:hypothetical protein
MTEGDLGYFQRKALSVCIGSQIVVVLTHENTQTESGRGKTHIITRNYRCLIEHIHALETIASVHAVRSSAVTAGRRSGPRSCQHNPPGQRHLDV